MNYKTLKEIALDASVATGLELKVCAGNGVYGLQARQGHGWEWVYNGATKQKLAEFMWGLMRALSFMKKSEKLYKKMTKEIVAELKKCDTVADYMTPAEMVVYYRSEFSTEYEALLDKLLKEGED